MQVTINTHEDLISFLERDDITPGIAKEVTSKFLKLIVLYNKPVDELRKEVLRYIETFKGRKENPIFLEQLDLEFSITDIYNKNRC